MNKTMESLDYCEVCDRNVKADYEMPDGNYCCQNCYEDAVERAEMAYEAQKETEAGGN